jgi:hypothetical protein
MKWALGIGSACFALIVAWSFLRTPDPGFSTVHQYYMIVQILLLPVTFLAAYLVVVARGGLRNEWIERHITTPLQKIWGKQRDEGREP